jgi:hypothetical protein
MVLSHIATDLHHDYPRRPLPSTNPESILPCLRVQIDRIDERSVNIENHPSGHSAALPLKKVRDDARFALTRICTIVLALPTIRRTR